jgi:glycosyltransferase involved in cell wall biosynthesis
MAASPTSSPLTVAVPTCNGARHLDEALRSILAQHGIAFELLVSDDRSDDDTLEVVRAAAGDRARIEVNSERLGLAGNWNRCAALARTPLVAIFHQDDVMLPGHLQAHASPFGADESVGLVASASLVIDERGEPVSPNVVSQGGLGPSDRLFDSGELAAQMTSGNPLRCSAVTIRLAAHRESGGFDPSLQYVLDWDFWLRVSRTWKLAWLARPTVRIRWHSSSETHRFKTGTDDLDETSRLLERLFSLDWKDRPDIAAVRRAANEALGRAFLNRASDALHAGRHELAREALRRAIARSPVVIGAILRDPRLCVQMAALAAAPRLAARLFSSPSRSDSTGLPQALARTR